MSEGPPVDGLHQILARIDELGERLDRRIDQLGEHLDTTDRRIDQLGERLDRRIDQLREEMGGRIDQLGVRIDQLGVRIKKLEGVTIKGYIRMIKVCSTVLCYHPVCFVLKWSTARELGVSTEQRPRGSAIPRWHVPMGNRNSRLR